MLKQTTNKTWPAHAVVESAHITNMREDQYEEQARVA